MTNTTATQLPEFPDRLLTMRQAAQILNLSVRTVQNKIKDGELASFVIGKRIRRIRYTAILAYIDQMEKGAGGKGEDTRRQLSLLPSVRHGKDNGRNG